MAGNSCLFERVTLLNDILISSVAFLCDSPDSIHRKPQEYRGWTFCLVFTSIMRKHLWHLLVRCPKKVTSKFQPVTVTSQSPLPELGKHGTSQCSDARSQRPPPPCRKFLECPLPRGQPLISWLKPLRASQNPSVNPPGQRAHQELVFHLAELPLWMVSQRASLKEEDNLGKFKMEKDQHFSNLDSCWLRY